MPGIRVFFVVNVLPKSRLLQALLPLLSPFTHGYAVFSSRETDEREIVLHEKVSVARRGQVCLKPFCLLSSSIHFL